jgi:tripartite-type tricarboxylate transporter receptor subunit TctC
MKRFICLAAAAIAFAAAPAGAQSQYPSKTIRFVAGFPPGGVVDILARTLAEKMSESLGQQVIVENRPGATGTIAHNLVAKAPADGYTILMTAPTSHAIVSVLNAPLPYDAEKDFAPVGKVAELALVLVVHPSLSVASARDLIELAKKKPNELTYGSAGVGAIQHIATELFSTHAGIKMVHVPYKGSAPLLVDLLAGRLALSIDNPQTVLPRVKSGELRALAVTSKERWFAAPDIPTVAEAAGIPGFDVLLHWGVVVPAGTPKDIISVLNREVVKALKQDDVKDRLAAQGVKAAPSTPEEFGRLIRTEFETWTPERVRAAGMKTN